MARTALMRSLRQLAQDHAEAAEQGIEVSELRERRQAQISRRELLKRAGAPGPRSPSPGA